MPATSADGGTGAWVLNCKSGMIMPILVAARLLKPLGNRQRTASSFLPRSELLEQVQDRTWLAKVTNALNQHWQKKNAAKKNGLVYGSQNGYLTANVGGKTTG